MPARIDPFVDVLLRERGDRLYLLPDEPVTMVKDGKPRKVSRQPLTDQHIYALLVEVAPSESADHIDKMAETEFEYAADRGLVRVRIVPEQGRLTAVVAPLEQVQASNPAPALRDRGGADGRSARGTCGARRPRAATRPRERPRRATAGATASGPSRRIRRPPVPGGRAGARRAAEAARAIQVVRPAPAGGRAAAVPHQRRDRAASVATRLGR